MAHIQWTDDLNTGIREIDDQHRQLVDYLNDLHDAIMKDKPELVAYVIENLIDYTQFHFGFEESIMEENEYEYAAPHKHIHDLFIRRVLHYKERFSHGEAIAPELHTMLKRWLINHIAHDDQNFAKAMQEKKEAESEKHRGFFARLFGR